MKNYYEILNLEQGATQDEIKTAYRKMAVKWHPDKHLKEEDKEEAEEKFKDIGEAYENLQKGIGSSEDKRSHHFQKDDLEEMMRNFARQAGFKFGNMSGQEDFYEQIPVPVTIKNLYNEEELTVVLKVYEKSEVEKCSTCEGTGQIIHSQLQENMIIQRATICHVCKGQGFEATGNGTDQSFKIKANVENLQRPLPLGKVGSYNPITEDKNQVLARLELQKSLNYHLVENGISLMMTLPVEYEHLQDGKKIKILIFGNKVTVDIPAKPSMQRMIVVPGKGMPYGRQRGNLYVKLDLKYKE